jgi:hypothetical protein
VRNAKKQNDSTTDRTVMRERLMLSLAAEWPASVLSQTEGEKIWLSRAGRGDRVPGIWLRGTGATVVVVHPEGSEAARKTPQVQKLLQAGNSVLLIDTFQTGAARARRDNSQRHHLTFNKADDANRVQDILTALAFLNRSDVELVGLGKAGIWCQFAAAVAKTPVKLKAQLGDFRGEDQDFIGRFFVPGIQRAGGLRAATMLTR